MKKLYLFFYVFLILFIANCSSHVAKKQVDKNIVKNKVLNLIFPTIVFFFNSIFIFIRVICGVGPSQIGLMWFLPFIFL